MSLRRIAAIVRKELLHILRDPRNLFLVTVAPAFLLFLLAYVFSFDVGQLSLAVLDLDHSPLSRRYLAELTNNGDLNLDAYVSSYKEAVPLLVGGEVDAALVIPPGFAASYRGGEAAPVQIVVDGADPTAGGEALEALQARSLAFSPDGPASVLPGGMEAAVIVRTQAWYNTGQESLFSMVPGLLAIVLIMPTLALTLALTREREAGTLEGLVATPLSGLEYLGGKLLAYIAAALVSTVLALLVAVFWFGVPFRGGLPLYLLLAAVYLLACMGAAVLIAHFVKSQQTAMFVVLLAFLVPSFFLSGLIMPVSTESLGTLLTAYALPTTHFVEISRALFLKGLGLGDLLRPALILLGMGVGGVGVGFLLFRKKVA
jgi:ABC-2 type transport system permease protein